MAVDAQASTSKPRGAPLLLLLLESHPAAVAASAPFGVRLASSPPAAAESGALAAALLPCSDCCMRCCWCDCAHDSTMRVGCAWSAITRREGNSELSSRNSVVGPLLLLLVLPSLLPAAPDDSDDESAADAAEADNPAAAAELPPPPASSGRDTTRADLLIASSAPTASPLPLPPDDSATTSTTKYASPRSQWRVAFCSSAGSTSMGPTSPNPALSALATSLARQSTREPQSSMHGVYDAPETPGRGEKCAPSRTRNQLSTTSPASAAGMSTSPATVATIGSVCNRPPRRSRSARLRTDTGEAAAAEGADGFDGELAAELVEPWPRLPSAAVPLARVALFAAPAAAAAGCDSPAGGGVAAKLFNVESPDENFDANDIPCVRGERRRRRR